jgi:hypothetical protein
MVLNKVKKLPEMAVQSALDKTDSNIYIGFVREEDTVNLPRHDRITYIDLRSDLVNLALGDLNSRYLSFDDSDFFKLVQLKWHFFKRVIDTSNSTFITYLDFDVIVMRDFTREFENIFHNFPKIQIIIQDATTEISNPRLCMGIFAFKADLNISQTLENCQRIHSQGLIINPYFGDDDAITTYFFKSKDRSKFLLLPQQSYPVGKLLNLFLPIRVLKHLRPQVPYIFHANYVVGIERKILLLYLLKARENTFFYARALLSFVLVPLRLPRKIAK